MCPWHPERVVTVTFTQISEDYHGNCQHFLKLYDGLLTACWSLLWNGMKPKKNHYFNCNVADLEGYSLNLIVVGVHPGLDWDKNWALDFLVQTGPLQSVCRYCANSR